MKKLLLLLLLPLSLFGQEPLPTGSKLIVGYHYQAPNGKIYVFRGDQYKPNAYFLITSKTTIDSLLDTVSAYLKGYLNGVKVYDTVANKSTNTIHPEQPIYVLGKSAIAGSTINNAFDGNLYFHIRDDGTLTDTQVANLHTNTQTLLTALGKDL